VCGEWEKECEEGEEEEGMGMRMAWKHCIALVLGRRNQQGAKRRDRKI